MNRRNLLRAASAIALSSVAVMAVADHTETHQHGAGTSPLLNSALHCVKTGEVCEAHCFDRLAEGEKSLAACARSVNALIAVCSALAVLAAQNSPLLPRYAAVAKDVCKACEDECLKHSDKHAPCKACADACADCARECAKIAA